MGVSVILASALVLLRQELRPVLENNDQDQDPSLTIKRSRLGPNFEKCWVLNLDRLYNYVFAFQS